VQTHAPSIGRSSQDHLLATLPHVDCQADTPFAHRISGLQAGEKIWFPIYTDILVLLKNTKPIEEKGVNEKLEGQRQLSALNTALASRLPEDFACNACWAKGKTCYRADAEIVK
jgi:hypothetical protein